MLNLSISHPSSTTLTHPLLPLGFLERAKQIPTLESLYVLFCCLQYAFPDFCNMILQYEFCPEFLYIFAHVSLSERPFWTLSCKRAAQDIVLCFTLVGEDK